MAKSEQTRPWIKNAAPGKGFQVAHVEVKDRRVRLALELLKANHARGLSELADVLNLSPSRFRHVFRSEVGVSPACYLKAVRMSRAKELLETTFLSVKEVAAAAGINDVSHFVRDYKARYGCTPSQTRTQRAATPASK